MLPIQQQQSPYGQIQDNFLIQQLETKGSNILDWNKKVKSKLPNRNEDYKDQAEELLTEIRKDLSNLQRLHRALLMADNFDEKFYKRENKEKGAAYQNDLIEVKKLSNEEPSEKLVNDLTVISTRLDLDIDNINALFPQMIYSSVHMLRVVRIVVNQIGYPEFKTQAEASYESLLAQQPSLHLGEIQGEDKTSINSAIHTINVLNNMRKDKNDIAHYQKLDAEKAKSTRKYILTGMATTLIFLTAVILGMSWKEITWDDIRDLPILGIPLGIGIWAFIGSFAAMLQQFYQKSIYEFGDTLKWVLIRPVLGVVMGSAIYLAFSNGFGITTDTGNGGLIYLVAFFVGLSDSFTLGIIDRLQGALTNSVTENNPLDPNSTNAKLLALMEKQAKANNNQNANILDADVAANIKRLKLEAKLKAEKEAKETAEAEALAAQALAKMDAEEKLRQLADEEKKKLDAMDPDKP